jgi:predicted Ser/Thr protein kinase
MQRLCYLTLAVILAVAIQTCVGQVPVNSTRLSSPRKAVSSVSIGDRVLFIGGYDFHDLVPSDKIDVFDTTSQNWVTSLSLPKARGYVSPVIVDSNIYFLGGITRTNPPYLYVPANNSFVPLGSGPTVRTPKQLSILGSSLTVVGSYSADFLDLSTGNWTYNSNLTKIMMSRRDTMKFAYQQWVFVIGGVEISDEDVDFTGFSNDAWVFNSQTNELLEYTDITTFNVVDDPLVPLTYAGSNDVVVVRLPDRCLLYHLTRGSWVEQLNAINVTSSVTLNNVTYLFGNNYVIYDWNQILTEESQDTNILFGFAINNTVVYIRDSEVIFIGGPRIQQTGLRFSGPIRFAQEWNPTQYVFADDFQVYVVDVAQKGLYELADFTRVISLFVSPDGNLQVFDTTNTVTWSTYESGPFPTRISYPTIAYLFQPTALVDGNFVDVKEGAMPITDSTVINPLSMNFWDPILSAQEGNTFIVMNQYLAPTSYEQYEYMDIYDYINDTWTTVEMPPQMFLPPSQKGFAETFMNAAAFSDSIIAWIPGAFAVYDIAVGNWTPYDNVSSVDGFAPVVRTDGMQHLHFQVPVINDFAYVHSGALLHFYKFAPDLLNFTETADMPTPGIAIQQPVAYHERIYVSMKNNDDANIAALYFYDTTTDGWQSNLLPLQTQYAAIAASEDYIVVVGSDNKLQILSIERNQWNVQDIEYTVLPSTILHVGNFTLLAGGNFPSERYSAKVLIVSDDIVFIEPPLASPLSAVEPPIASPIANGLTVGELVAAIVVPIAVILAAGLAVLLVLLKKRKKSKHTTTVGLEQQFGEWFTPFNDIKFGEQLGQGGSGQVFKGKWKNTDVALKVSMTQANQSVIAELSLMINLRPHPNVVQLFGYSVHPETNSIILILEFCNGGSLDDYLVNQKTAISAAQKIQMLQGIARGIVHLHSNNIVHRDLAARNVLLNQGEPKITDFGMSRVVDEQQRGTTKSELGPIRWMAPESLRDKQYSNKSGMLNESVLLPSC